MTAGFMAYCEEKPAVIDRRYSGKGSVHGIEFVNESRSRLFNAVVRKLFCDEAKCLRDEVLFVPICWER